MSQGAVPKGSKAEILKRFGPDVLDYSKCSFTSIVDVPLPDAIKDLLNRCFESFGWDVWLMRERWTEEETKVYACSPYKDICCADVCGWSMHQTGKLVHEKRGQRILSPDAGLHLAAYWLPIEGVNTHLVRIVHKANKVDGLLVKNDGDPRFGTWKPKDDDWLPGDYLLYSNSPGAGVGHVNVYLGPFREVVQGDDGPTLIDPTYHMINGSIHEYGGNAVVRPKPIDNLYWYLSGGKTVWHCRVLAVEALYDEIVGYPVRLGKRKDPAEDRPKPPVEEKSKETDKGKDKGKDKSADKPDPEAEAKAKEARIAALWDDVTSPETAYPLGKNRSFHDGVHFHLGQHIATDEIVAFGPGRIVLARMGSASAFGGTSFVLLEHRVDPKTRRLLAPPKPAPPPKEGAESPAQKKKKAIEERAVLLYSLYMHLAPLSAYHGKGDIEGVPTLNEQAPPWLRRCWLEPVPKPREFVPHDADIAAILVHGKDHALMALSPATTRKAPHDCNKPTCLPVSAGGKSYLALPYDNIPSNEEAWSNRAPIATVPKGAKLVYVNKLDGSILDVGTKVPETTTLVASDKGQLAVAATDASGGAYVAINAFARPGFKPASAAKAFEEIDAQTLRIKGKLTLYLDTKGEGDEARLIANQTKALAATPDKPLTFGFKRSKAGKTHQADTIWLEATACVLLTAAEKTEREEKLIKDVALAKEVNPRLQARHATIFAAKIGPKEDWLLDGGMLVPNQETLAKRPAEAKLLTLYPDIKGSGKNRTVLTPKPSKQVDADRPSVLAIAPGDFTVQPLDLFVSGGRQYALVEVMLAVEESAVQTSNAAVDEARKKNENRKKIVDALMKQEVVDFAALAKGGTITELDRNIGAEPVGTFDKTQPGVASFHFEIFSGKNIIDQSVKGTAGTVVPVPRSRWVVLKDDQHDYFTPELVTRTLRALTKMPPSAAVDARPLQDALATSVPKPAEWAEFYQKNVQALSRVITVHKPEWAIDWEQVWKADKTLGRAWDGDQPASLAGGKADAEAIKAALKAFQWWGPKLDGVEDVESVFFYHPLRFIEWLKTGADVTVVGLAKPEDAVIEIEIDGEKTPLEYDPVSQAWCFRTMLGDIRQGKNAKISLGAGFQTENREFAVRLRRGEVTALSLVNPSLAVDVETATSAVGYIVSLTQSSIPYKDAAYLLADGNRHMARSEYSRATFRVDVAYNVLPPTSISISIEGEGLYFFSYLVSGIDVTADGDGKPIVEAKKKDDSKGDKKEDRKGPHVQADGTVVLPHSSKKVSIDLTTVPPENKGTIQRSRSLSITCEVGVPDASPGDGTFGKVSAVELIAKVSGGDLGSRKASTQRIKTREIKREKEGTDRGEDIAKLQVYLSQIEAVDHKPCYRIVGTHKEKVEVQVVTPAKGKRPEKVTTKEQKVDVADEYAYREYKKTDKEKHEAVIVNGEYGGELAKGLWRFIYSYAHAKHAGDIEEWKLGAVKCTDKGGSPLPDVPKDELFQVPTERFLDSSHPTFTSLDFAGDDELAVAPWAGKAPVIERFLARVNHPTEYPVVNAGLLSEIVRRFRTPFVLPRVAFELVYLQVPAAHRDVVFTNEWNKDWITTSALLPAEDKLVLKVKCGALDDVAGNVDVVMRLPEESGYRLSNGATSLQTKLADLCKGDGHALVPSGKLGLSPADNTVSVRSTDGRLLNAVELCGAPDLSQPSPQPLRAAALLQIYLSVVPATPGGSEPAYKHTEKEKIEKKKDKDKDKAKEAEAEKREPMMMAKIDGKWDKRMVALLEEWKSANGVSGDYVATVKALKKAYDAAPATGQQAVTPAAAGGAPAGSSPSDDHA